MEKRASTPPPNHILHLVHSGLQFLLSSPPLPLDITSDHINVSLVSLQAPILAPELQILCHWDETGIPASLSGILEAAQKANGQADVPVSSLISGFPSERYQRDLPE